MSTTPTFQTGHIGLNVSNLEKSKKFYQEVFGFTLAEESQQPGRRYAFLSSNGRLILTLWEQSEGTFETRRPGLHHLSFQVEHVDDVHIFERRLQELNVDFLYDGIVPHGEGAQSGGIFFTDPDGIRLEIYTPTGANENPAPVAAAPTCGFF